MQLNRLFSFKLLFILLPVSILLVVLNYFGWMDYLEYQSLDWRFRFRGEIDAPVKLIYVDLDSEAIELMGERPLPRVFFAETVDALINFGKAKVVGIDAVFSESAHSVLVDNEKVKLDNEAFRGVVERQPGLVLAASYTSQFDPLSKDHSKLKVFPFIYKGYTNANLNSLPEQPDLDLIGSDGGNIGLININDQYSPGPIPRWAPLFAQTPGPTYLTLALEMLRVYYGIPKTNITITDDFIFVKGIKGEILHKIPLREKQMLEINWYTSWSSNKTPHYSIRTILGAAAWIKHGSEEQKKEAEVFFKDFKDSIILIGPVDPLLHDLSPAPLDFEPVPRVSAHGNLLKTIAGGDYITRFPFLLNAVIAITLSILMTSLGIWSGQFSGLTKFMCLALLFSYIVISFYLFSIFHIVMPLVTPVIAGVSTTFFGVIFQLVSAEKQKGRIKGLFGTYVSPDLVNKIIESGEEPQLGGVEETISAFFSDVENFSTFSEVLNPSQLVDLMNEYLTTMTDILQNEGGTLDKYIGDAIVAMFGAPLAMKEHAAAACRVACKIQQAQLELCEKWKTDRKNWPALIFKMRTRVGLNSGLAIVGNMGSSTRFNYTMMGDTVNLAARCESGAKSYGVYGMVTEDTKQLAEENDKSVFYRYLDNIVVKGRTHPVRMYELIGLNNNISDRVQDCVELYEQGMKFYLQQNWDAALSLFEKSSGLERFKPGRDPVITNPSLVFTQRCQYMKENPPEGNWDGVFSMKSK